MGASEQCTNYSVSLNLTPEHIVNRSIKVDDIIRGYIAGVGRVCWNLFFQCGFGC